MNFIIASKFLIIFKKWVVPVSYFFIHFIIYGIIRLSSIFFIEFQDFFKVNKLFAALPLILSPSIRNLSEPFVGFLVEKLNTKLSLIISSFLIPLAIGLSFFAFNITWLTLLYGALFGIGYTLVCALLPSFVDQFNSQERSSRHDFLRLTFIGQNLSIFVLPYFLEQLLFYYGLPDSFLIISGLSLHIIPLILIIKVFLPRRQKNNPRPIFTGIKTISHNVSLPEIINCSKSSPTSTKSHINKHRSVSSYLEKDIHYINSNCSDKSSICIHSSTGSNEDGISILDYNDSNQCFNNIENTSFCNSNSKKEKSHKSDSINYRNIERKVSKNFKENTTVKESITCKSETGNISEASLKENILTVSEKNDSSEISSLSNNNVNETSLKEISSEIRANDVTNSEKSSECNEKCISEPNLCNKSFEINFQKHSLDSSLVSEHSEKLKPPDGSNQLLKDNACSNNTINALKMTQNSYSESLDESHQTKDSGYNSEILLDTPESYSLGCISDCVDLSETAKCKYTQGNSSTESSANLNETKTHIKDSHNISTNSPQNTHDPPKKKFISSNATHMPKITVKVIECTVILSPNINFRSVEEEDEYFRKHVCGDNSNILPYVCYEHTNTEKNKGTHSIFKNSKAKRQRAQTDPLQGTFIGNTETFTCRTKKNKQESSCNISNVFELYKRSISLFLSILVTLQEIITIFMMIVILDFAQDLKLPSNHFKWVLMIYAAGTVLGRLCVELLINKVMLKKSFILFACLLGMSASVFGLSQSSKLSDLIGSYATYAVFEVGSTYTLILFIDEHKETNPVSLSLKYLKLISGILLLIIPVVIDAGHNEASSYETCFCIISGISLLAAFMSLSLFYTPSNRTKNLVNSSSV